MSREIALEGLDLSGKSTLAKQLADRLKARHVGEPFTESVHAVRVKEMITANYAPKVYEIMALIAQRVEAYQRVKGPYLSRGRDIVSDRCVISSMVYQSSEEADAATVLEMNESILKSYGYQVSPDILIFIDMDYETYMSRCETIGRDLDGKEKWLQTRSNFESQRQKYIDAIDTFKQRSVNTIVFTVPAGVTVEDVLDLVEPAQAVVA